MTLGQLKRDFSKILKQCPNPEVWHNIKYDWGFIKLDGEDVGLARKSVEWLITILGADADVVETIKALKQSEKFLALNSKHIHIWRTLAVIGQVRGGYSLLKSMLPLSTSQDSAEQEEDKDQGSEQGEKEACSEGTESPETEEGTEDKEAEEGSQGEQGNEGGEDKEAENGQGEGDAQAEETEGEGDVSGKDSADGSEEDLGEPSQGEPNTEDGQGETPQGASDSQGSEDGIWDSMATAVAPLQDALSLKNRNTPAAFWPQEELPLPGAAARQAARLLLKKVRELSDTGRVEAPLISGKKVVKELISRRYSLPKMRGRAITAKRKSLIMVDISGSCSAHSAQTNAAAKALYEAAPDLVVVMHHANGDYCSHLGEMPSNIPAFLRPDHIEGACPIVEWWVGKWGLIVSFGDDDSLGRELNAVELGATVLKLDSYGKNKYGFQFDAKRTDELTREYGSKSGGRFIRYEGCDDAPHLVTALRNL